jgi:hypothetical protein
MNDVLPMGNDRGYRCFLGTWLVGAFTLGRAVEQMKAGFKEEISAEQRYLQRSIS